MIFKEIIKPKICRFTQLHVIPNLHDFIFCWTKKDISKKAGIQTQFKGSLRGLEWHEWMIINIFGWNIPSSETEYFVGNNVVQELIFFLKDLICEE